MTNENIDALWEKIEPRVEALISERINLFYDAMMVRRQIPRPPDPVERS
jgi:hypothetical protein